ncbi:MAG: hypothetical protein P1P71_06305 [Anaerosomatales bacterium]|nr:hypothetical protein [Anaerosomatales bacterium]
MASSTGAVVARVVALLLSVVWGFFVAFNVVFSDVFGVGDMVGAIGFVAGAYALLGLLFGLAGPRTGWRWMWWLSAPGVLLVFLGLFDNVGRALYHAAVIAALMAGSAFGGWLGAWVRGRFSRGPATP